MREGRVGLMKPRTYSWVTHLIDSVKVFRVLLVLLGLFVACLALVLGILLGEGRTSVASYAHKVVAWIRHVVSRSVHCFTLTGLVNWMHGSQVFIINTLLWAFIVITCSLVMILAILLFHIFDGIVPVSLIVISISWIDLSPECHSLVLDTR